MGDAKMAAKGDPHYLPVVEVTRGSVVESLHRGAAALCRSDGKLAANYGDPQIITFMRSSAKPFQAIPLVESGAADRLGISEPELALICASHSGTDEHLAVAHSLQGKVGIREADLQCGTHPPIHTGTAQRLREMGEEPTPNRHNCSGKHSGMLALAADLDQSPETYLDLEGPVQSRILRAFAEMCDVDPEEVRIGTDGCSAPNFAVPLRQAALAFARFAHPGQLHPARTTACRRIFKAMVDHPEVVAGPGRLDTLLMEAGGGRWVVKSGAEGYYGVAIPPGVIDKGPYGYGLAAKIADGNLGRRAGSIMILQILKSLGLVEPGDREELAAFWARPLENYRGLQVGEIRPCFELGWKGSG